VESSINWSRLLNHLIRSADHKSFVRRFQNGLADIIVVHHLAQLVDSPSFSG
jgi:hypothetical protein